MTTTNNQLSRSLKRGLVKAGKGLLRILGILLVAFLAYFLFVAAYEWVGLILADKIVFA